MTLNGICGFSMVRNPYILNRVHPLEVIKMPDELQVGDITAKRGELKTGIIKGVELVNSMSIDIPVLVMNGAEEGPTLVLVSTQHGIEIQGIEVILKIMRERVNPKHLRGAIIGIPVANPLAFMHHKYKSWIDDYDVSRERADNPTGNTTERLANALWTEAWSKADLIVNIHCNTRPDSLVYQWIDVGNPKTREQLEKMAEAFGVTTIVSETPVGEQAAKKGVQIVPFQTTTLNVLATEKGIPNLLVELIDGRWISEPSTSVGIKGTLNIMKVFNMIDGEPDPQEGIPIVPGVNRFYGMLNANRGGLIRLFKKPGDPIKQDEVVAEIYNLYGDVLEEVKMPVDGYVWAYPCGQSLGTSGGLQAVQTGANVAYVFTHEER